MRPEWLIKCSLILVCISSLGDTKEREMYVAYHDIMFIWNEAKVMGNISLYTGKSILKHYSWMHFPEVTIWLLEHHFLYRSDASWFLFLAFFVSRPRPSLTVQSAAFSLLWIGQRVASASLELELQWELSDHTAWDMLLKSIQSEFFFCWKSFKKCECEKCLHNKYDYHLQWADHLTRMQMCVNHRYDISREILTLISKCGWLLTYLNHHGYLCAANLT